MKKTFGCLLWVALLSPALAPLAKAQTSWDYAQAGQTLVQDFNSLPLSGSFAWLGRGPHALAAHPIGATGLAGWMAWQLGGSAAHALFGITTGSVTGSGVYSVGSSGSSDRALGTLASSTGVYAIGVKWTNLTGQTLQSLQISLEAEQWRRGGSGNPNRWVCKMATGKPGEENTAQWTDVPGLDLRSLQSATGAATLNGNLSDNRQSLSVRLTNLGWQAGNWLMLRWEDSDESGSDDLVAIDQFRFSADTENEVLPALETLLPLSPSPTAADTVLFGIQFSGNVLGLGMQHLALVSQGLEGAHFAGLSGSGKAYQAQVVTGRGQGYLVLGLTQTAGILPGLRGLPQWSSDTLWVDKKPPVLLGASWENRVYRRGDTVRIRLQHQAEQGPLQLLQGSWDSENITRLFSLNDTTAECWAVVADTGTDLAAQAPVALRLQVQDAAGNAAAWQLGLDLDQDRIDRLLPQLLETQCGTKNKLGTGDTLLLRLRFSEAVVLDTAAGFWRHIPVTVGQRVKNLFSTQLAPQPEWVFQYLVQNGETDRDGLRLSSAFQAKNWRFYDLAGHAISPAPNTGCLSAVTTDGRAPVFVLPRDTVLWWCPGTNLPRPGELLATAQGEAQETLRWEWVYQNEKTGTDSLVLAQSNNNTQPQQLAWPPAFLQNKTRDSIWARVSDGVHVSQKKILVQKPNFTGLDSLVVQAADCAPGQISGLLLPPLGAGQSLHWEWRKDSAGSTFAAANDLFVPSTNKTVLRLKKNSRGIWLRQIAAEGTCRLTSPALLIPPVYAHYWTGKLDSFFHVAQNWCEEELPSDGATVVVPAGKGFIPQVDVPLRLQSLQLEDHARLRLRSQLTLVEKLVAPPAAIDARGGSLHIATAQSFQLSGAIFGDKGLGQLQVSQGGAVYLTDTLFLSSALGLVQGTLHTQGKLKLWEGAWVLPAGPGARIAGPVELAAPRTWLGTGTRWVHLPFVQGAGPLQPAAPWKHSSTATFPLDSFWLRIDPRDQGNPAKNSWVPGQSIWHVPADSSFGALAPWLRGELQVGSMEQNLMGSNGLAGKWWQNPYLHPVNLSRLGGHGAVWCWAWDPQGGKWGRFQLLSPQSHYRLAPFESLLGFLPPEKNDALVWSESAKWLPTDHPQVSSHLTGATHHFVLDWYSDNLLQDQVHAFDHPQGQAKWDPLDAPKPPQPGVLFFCWSTDGKALSADTRRWSPQTVWELGFAHAPLGEHVLKVQSANLPLGNNWVVFDRFALRSFPLKSDSSYHFNITADALSQDPKRFLVSPALQLPREENLGIDFTVKLYPNPAKDWLQLEWRSLAAQALNLELLSNNGTLLKRFGTPVVQKGQFALPVADLSAGLYLLRIGVGEQQKILRFVKLP